MRIVVTGATGNLGTSVLAALAQDDTVREIVGIARRIPDAAPAKTRFVAADVSRDALEPHLTGADAVIHLAWRVQNAHHPEELERVNVGGSRRVFEAAAACAVPALVYASSMGAYSPGPKDSRVGEDYPTGGVPSSAYSRQKAKVERVLDEISRANPGLRVVRIRPALVFQREAASGIRRAVVGPWAPNWLFDRRWSKVVPLHPRFRFQALHGSDVAEAFRRALLSDKSGAFNVAAEPVLDSDSLARILDARRVALPRQALRSAARLAFALRLSRLDPGWVDLCFASPLLDCSRARDELNWIPRYSSAQALLELLDGLQAGTGFDTPPLAPWGRTHHAP